MPTYEYACDSCGHRFDEFQSITEDPLEICPVCNEKVHRVINGGAGLIFKGTGFYITDYKKSNVSPTGGNGKHPKPADAVKNSGAAGSTDTKPDPKKE